MQSGMRVHIGFLRRLLTSVLSLLVVATAAAAAVPQTAVTLGDISEAEIRAAKPGHILRVYPQIGGASSNAKAFRILYRSTGLKNDPIVVSGTIIFPAGPAPRTGRNIIAWAHYTTGVAERCAPTLLPDLSGTIAGLDDMLARGYVVVATDYEGLGVPGIHPYLVGLSEARSVLDSVRAVRELNSAHATDRFAVWGHSQGGHAALFTGELAAEYAPELKLVGIAAAAPATYLVDLFKADRGSLGGNSLTAMAVLSWSQVYRLPLDSVVATGANKSFELVARSCIQSIAELLKLSQLAKPLQRDFLKADPTTLPAWRDVMERNTPGRLPAGVPVFIAQGTGDVTVKPAITLRYAKFLCAAGTSVDVQLLKGVSHSFIGEKSAHRAVVWITHRYAGRTAPSDCAR
jgi:acetyl esterase/lipase